MLTRILCLSDAQIKSPFHLREWKVEHVVIPIDQAECGKTVDDSLEGLESECHDVRDQGEDGVIYVRILHDPDMDEYWVSLLYTPWPAYMVNPWRNTHGYVRAGSLCEALRGTHRLFPYYTHRGVAPIPFYGAWVDYCLTEEAVEAIEEEALGQGIGRQRIVEGA